MNAVINEGCVLHLKTSTSSQWVQPDVTPTSEEAPRDQIEKMGGQVLIKFAITVLSSLPEANGKLTTDPLTITIQQQNPLEIKY